MSCTEFRPDLSPLADNALEGQRAVLVWRHLHRCSACRSEFNQIQAVRTLLSEAGRVAPPENLALAIRVRISREATLSWSERLRLRLGNLLQPLAVPALAGICSAFVTFILLAHSFALPSIVGITNDTPVYLLTTQPRVSSMAAPEGLKTGDQGVFIEVFVDSEGRISDYHFLTPVSDPETMAKLLNALVMTRFDPATTFGVPRPGKAILNYRSISIKG